MADGQDHYKVLQVDSEADPDIIQAAYRRLAQKFHPDVTRSAEGAARMIAINVAWETLHDPALRSAYDRERDPSLMRGAAAGSTQGASATDPGSPRGGPARAYGDAGPPAGEASGSVITFGRYAGWSLGQIARQDLEYIEWLDRMPIGRPYRAEIDAILRRTGRRRSAEVEAGDRRGLFRRR